MGEGRELHCGTAGAGSEGEDGEVAYEVLIWLLEEDGVVGLVWTLVGVGRKEWMRRTGILTNLGDRDDWYGYMGCSLDGWMLISRCNPEIWS